MAECERCMLPDHLPRIVLDGGVCNYCSHWERHKNEFFPGERLEAIFQRRIQKMRGRYPYDALVGLSGGKDSSYVLYQLVRQHGLRVLAVTFDNGFLNDYAWQNVRSVVEALRVAHFTHKPDEALQRAFYRASLQRFGEPCIACAIGMYFVVLKICQERRIPFFIRGRSPFQMFRNFREDSEDPFLDILQTSLQDHAFGRLKRLHQRMDGHVQRWLAQLFDDRDLRERVYREFFPDPEGWGDDFAAEFLGYFVYHPYDEEAIKCTLEREVGYRRPEGDGLLSHADCLMHDASDHIFETLHGMPGVLPEVAVMLRRGLLTRAEAEELLAQKAPVSARVEESIGHLCAKLGMERSEFETLMKHLQEDIREKFDCR